MNPFHLPLRLSSISLQEPHGSFCYTLNLRRILLPPRNKVSFILYFNPLHSFLPSIPRQETHSKENQIVPIQCTTKRNIVRASSSYLHSCRTGANITLTPCPPFSPDWSNKQTIKANQIKLFIVCGLKPTNDAICWEWTNRGQTVTAVCTNSCSDSY